MSADTHIAQLQTVYQTYIDGLQNTLEKAKAQVCLDTWKAAEIQYQNILAAEAQSYTTTGRTITKRAISQAREARDSAAADLEGLLGVGDASVTYVDNGGSIPR